MRATEVLAEPLADATAALLTVPMVELYAVLWRIGLLEVRRPETKDRLPQEVLRQPA